MSGPFIGDAREEQDLAFRLANNLVTINVSDGDIHKAYLIDKDLLCRASPVFSTSFQGSSGGGSTGYWKETNEMAMNWPECNPQIFDIFVQWLHTDTVPPNSVLQRLKGISFPTLQLLVLADRAMIAVLQQKCYDRIRDDLQRTLTPPKAFVQELYSIDLLNEKLRRYVAKLYACHAFRAGLRTTRSTATEPRDELLQSTPEFAVDVVNAFSSLGRNVDGNARQYHFDVKHALMKSAFGRLRELDLQAPSAYSLSLHPYDDPDFKTYADV